MKLVRLTNIGPAPNVRLASLCAVFAQLGALDRPLVGPFHSGRPAPTIPAAARDRIIAAAPRDGNDPRVRWRRRFGVVE